MLIVFSFLMENVKIPLCVYVRHSYSLDYTVPMYLGTVCTYNVSFFWITADANSIYSQFIICYFVLLV